MYTNKCIICEREFESKIPHKITCSVECRKRNQANASYKNYKNKKDNGIIKICETCGKEFHTEREESRFCTRKCNNTGSQFKKERKIIYCLNCNKEIEIIKENPKNTRFCCIGCSNTYFKSHEDVLKICKWCGKEFIVPYKKRFSHEKFCTKSCAANHMNNIRPEEVNKKISETQKKQYASGERIHSWIGRHHTEETKKKISDNHISNETFKGKNNPMYGRNHAIETREKISNTRGQKIISGEYASWFDKGKVFSLKMNKEISYRSSWEQKVIESLDKDENVLMFIHEPFSIPYVFENVNKNYVPDIFIEYRDNTKKLIEIKPEYFVDCPINQSKFSAAEQYCEEKGIIFEVWTEKDVEKIV